MKLPSAGVAKPGQRRSPEASTLWGFSQASSAVLLIVRTRFFVTFLYEIYSFEDEKKGEGV
jgi:hypothetical protein